MSELVTIRFDNKKAFRIIVEEVKKASVYAQDAEVEIVQIKRVLKKISFDIKLELVRDHQKFSGLFSQKLLNHLIQEYDIRSRNIRENINERNNIINIKFLGYFAVKINKKIIKNSVKEAI